MLEMKFAVGVILLGAMLAGSTQAAESGVPVSPLLSKDLSVQAAPSTTRKHKSQQSRKAKPSDKAAAKKAAPKAKKQDSVTGTPPDSADQSVQLRGVRG